MGGRGAGGFTFLLGVLNCTKLWEDLKIVWLTCLRFTLLFCVCPFISQFCAQYYYHQITPIVKLF